jgi:putative tRNA-dihydrouridine synthase
MTTARALVEGKAETVNMVKPDPGDPVRSIQLYGVEPATTAAAVDMLVREGLADHVDLNFGCPAPKVTRRGGGSALPWKLDLFAEIVAAAVTAARRASASRDFEIPVTAKIRIGIDEEHPTFMDAARIAGEEGIAGLTLHARTTAQHYAGRARWEAIGELVQATGLPVFGNGDVFEAEDARRMMSATGCAGVAIGRGCQGRPWLFRDLAAAMHGSPVRARPGLAEVAAAILRHAELSVEHFNGDERRALREMRKHTAWYLRGFSVGGRARAELSLVSTLEELRSRLDALDLAQPHPDAATGPRGRAGRPKRPRLPEGWLDSRSLTPAQRERVAQAEIAVSGG